MGAEAASGAIRERPGEPPSEIDAVDRMVDAAQRLVTERIELARLDMQEAMATALWRTLGVGFILLLQLTGWWTLIAAAVLKLDDRLPLAMSLAIVGLLHIAAGGALFFGPAIRDIEEGEGHVKMAEATGAPPEVARDAPEDAREMLRQSIENDKAELRDAVDDLKAAVKTRLTLRDNIADNPAMWLLGAFAVGMWLSRRDSR